MPEKRVAPEDKEVLKHLARLGGLHDHVYTSSGELAKVLGVSQQTASRKILELLDAGYITRRMGTRKQLIRLAQAGVEVLRREHAELKGLFRGGETLPIKGKVVAGLGEGQYYISREGYRRAFKELLGFEPFPGTLNVEVEPLHRDKLGELRELQGFLIKEFQSEGRTFGAVKCFRARIGGEEAAAILPVRSHHQSVLEVVAPKSLRKALGLKDGQAVEVVVDVG